MVEALRAQFCIRVWYCCSGICFFNFHFFILVRSSAGQMRQRLWTQLAGLWCYRRLQDTWLLEALCAWMLRVGTCYIGICCLRFFWSNMSTCCALTCCTYTHLTSSPSNAFLTSSNVNFYVRISDQIISHLLTYAHLLAFAHHFTPAYIFSHCPSQSHSFLQHKPHLNNTFNIFSSAFPSVYPRNEWVFVFVGSIGFHQSCASQVIFIIAHEYAGKYNIAAMQPLRFASGSTPPITFWARWFPDSDS